MNTLPKHAGFTHLIREIGEGGWRGVDFAVYDKATRDPTMDTTTIWHLLESVQENADRFQKMINTPETEDFIQGIKLETAHQEERWGAEHDEGKGPQDWFWLVGYLAGKALMACITGDSDKALHHLVTTAAALANWHRKILGSGTMRPGIATPEKTEEFQEGVKAYLDGRTPCTNPYLASKNEWASSAWARGFRSAAMMDTRKHG